MRKSSKNKGLALALKLTLILFLAVVLFVAVYFVYHFFFEQEQIPEETIDYYGYDIPISQEVLKNELDPNLFYTENGRIYYNADNIKYGIDVSSHQGEIDWAAVKADGIDFAIIRVGYRGYGEEGAINLDEYFERNVAGALENGISVGVYFFSQAISTDEAREEAEFVLEHISGYDITYPVIFDWEYIEDVETARTYNYTQFDVSSFANAFCQVISDAGYSTTVYFNPAYGYMIYDVEEINTHTFWLAEYKDKPTFYYGFIIWQYTNEGSVAGISGNVDLNISFIDYYQQKMTMVQ